MPNLCTSIVKICPDLVWKFLKTLFLLQTHTICTSNESSNNTELKFDIKKIFFVEKFWKNRKKKIFFDREFLKKKFWNANFSKNFFYNPNFFFSPINSKHQKPNLHWGLILLGASGGRWQASKHGASWFNPPGPFWVKCH